MWPLLLVLARILADADSPPPDVEDDAVLLIKRRDALVGCPGSDGGITGGDAAIDAPGDAPAPADAGIDAGVPTPDAGTGCTMIPGDAVTMIVQPRISAGVSGARFAMLFVTPSRPYVELESNVFEPLAALTAPERITHVVEIEDPALGTTCRMDDWGGQSGCSGGGGGGGSWAPPSFDPSDDTDGGVVVETIGPYEIVRVQPADTGELVAWLDRVGFQYDQTDVDAVAPYIAAGYHVVAVRIALSEPMVDVRTVPIALTWSGSELRLPAALSTAREWSTVLTAYVAADGTYAFPDAHIVFSGRTGPSSYVTRNELALATLSSPADDPVAVRRLPDLTYRDTIETTEERYVPVEVECNQPKTHERDGYGCCSDCNARRDVRVDWCVLAVAVGFVLRRRRRR